MKVIIINGIKYPVSSYGDNFEKVKTTWMHPQGSVLMFKYSRKNFLFTLAKDCLVNQYLIDIVPGSVVSISYNITREEWILTMDKLPSEIITITDCFYTPEHALKDYLKMSFGI